MSVRRIDSDFPSASSTVMLLPVSVESKPMTLRPEVVATTNLNYATLHSRSNNYCYFFAGPVLSGGETCNSDKILRP